MLARWMMCNAAITTIPQDHWCESFFDENGTGFTVYSMKAANRVWHPGHPATFRGKNGRIQYQSSGFPGAKRYREEMRLRIETLRQL